MTGFAKRILQALLAVCVPLAAVAISVDARAAGGLPPGYTMSRTGSIHDFDYFIGGWTNQNHYLLNRGTKKARWIDFTGTLCMQEYLGGMATVDELYMPTRNSAGVTLRTFDPNSRQWSIYWVSSKTGQLGLPPVVGGFQGSRGEFYSSDTDNGQPVKVRLLWTLLDSDHARWQQAFSYDNRTWQTNWISNFTRADTAQICDSGRPKR